MPPRLLVDLQGKRVFVAGHKGLAGSALLRPLGREDCEILTVDRAASQARFSFRRRPPGRVTGPDSKQPRARLRFLSGLRRTSALTVRGTTSVQTALSRADHAQ